VVLSDWTWFPIEIYRQGPLYLRAGTDEQGRSNRCSCLLVRRRLGWMIRGRRIWYSMHSVVERKSTPPIGPVQLSKAGNLHGEKVGLAQWRERPWPQWRDPGFDSRGSHFDLCIFLAGTNTILVGLLRWLRIHHGHALLPNVRQGQIFNLLHTLCRVQDLDVGAAVLAHSLGALARQEQLVAWGGFQD
jgi:hypothetical protein